MSLEETFEEISREEGSEVKIQSNKFHEGGGAMNFQNYYELRIIYKEETIIISNLLGAQSYGLIVLKSNKLKKEIPFQIKTKDHFSSLFSLKKDRIKILCKDGKLKNFLSNTESLSQIKELINSTQFCPNIIGKRKKDYYSIETDYHLQFPERGSVIRPLIQLYKEIITEIS